MSDPERELLELGRSALEPTPAKRAALRARIEAAVGAGAPGPAPRAWGRGLLVGGAGAAVLAGAVLFFASSEPEPSREPAVPPPVTVTEPPAAAPLAPVATEVAERAPAPPAEAAPSAPRERAPRTPPKAEPTGDSLAAELALVAAARRALARGDGEEATAALARHAREFPAGALTEERSALEVLALCATGQRARAVVAARAFLSRYPGSVSSSSVRGSCVAATLDP